MNAIIVELGGKRWRWVWHPFGRSAIDGECDSPQKVGKAIRVRNSLNHPSRQERLLEVAIHEALHAIAWPIDEQLVRDGTEDIARLLGKLGYRRMP